MLLAIRRQRGDVVIGNAGFKRDGLVMMVDSKGAIAALSDIEVITRRVRQSKSYRIASMIMVLWGVLVGLGNVITFVMPVWAGLAWTGVHVVGIAGTIVAAAWENSRARTRTFDLRMLAAYLLFLTFGFLWTVGLVDLPPRLQDVFWPTYIMLAYAIAGLWLGIAFSVIGLAIAALTLTGYFWAGPWFELWMAAVNGGGLVLGGLWMRRN
jgi:hypothetical protein